VARLDAAARRRAIGAQAPALLRAALRVPRAAPGTTGARAAGAMPAIVAAWSAGALLLALRLLLGCHWVGRLRAGARLPESRWQGASTNSPCAWACARRCRCA
jgi:hypothetical protein